MVVVRLSTKQRRLESASMTGWKAHEIRQLNGEAERIKHQGKFQIVTEKWSGRWTKEWNQVAAVPYIAYVPEKDQILMLASCGLPHQSMILTSDDHGASWCEPWDVYTDDSGKSDTGMGVGLVYVEEGRAHLWTWDYGKLKEQHVPWIRWSSEDHGRTWTKGSPIALHGAFPWYPPTIERDAETGGITRMLETAYTYTRAEPEGWSQAHLRQSIDQGRTWSELVAVPQWRGANEVLILRAQNGDLVAACRTDWPERFIKTGLDHYGGLGISISRDDGRTWSEIDKLYDWGRHHCSMVLLPNGDIVLTYAVRKGYVDTPEGYLQFGVEAVVSRDHGQTWDLDHKYILAAWRGNRTDPDWSWTQSSQQTSSVLLPDGSILTAFGTGYRVVKPAGDPQAFSPRDVGLVKWRVSDEGLNAEKTVAKAPFDSDLRNVFDPLIGSDE